MDLAGADRTRSRAASPPGLSGWLTLLFAVAAGATVANVYFAQPLLVTIGREFALSPATVGIVVAITQLGYGLGLFLVVPLGDLLDRRRLVVTQLLLLAGALAVVGTAGTALVLLAGIAAVGLLAVVTQSMVAYAAALAGPANRGRIVGLVTSGVVIGILFARTVSGILADFAGWRSVYLVSAALTVTLAGLLYRVLPYHPPARNRLRYGRLLRSTVSLSTEEPLFRVRALLALLIFAAFSVLWSGVALPLSAPPLSLSHSAIGAFGLAGVAGALAAAPAGRLNDRGLAGWTTGVALVLLVLSWLPIGLTRQSLWALAIGAVLLDLAVQAVHVTNQSVIYELRPDAGSRLIGGYMVFYSIGSGAGGIASTAVYARAGWGGVCVLGAGISALAFLLWAVTLPRVRLRKSIH
ncbi:MFS transporter [Plantactinospora soyae]|uniref:MFS family arabinose efflux permease n=1 Tax=Plantactinospora soyae TaxID=1544732 RepID=A0A927M6W3_9ACTN|nr:MFS transporter [Plantactinospora soyae]MBE1487970.1 putative MFS family arabinose efflux permease [Plantactinospora soyae]